MSKRILSLPALLAAAVVATIVSSTGSAATEPQQQRVMVVQKHRFGTPNGNFDLYALSRGPLGFDSGKFVYMATEKPFVVREGQRAAVYSTIETLSGKRGSFDIRWRVEYVGAGDGQTVGIGTWSVVRGRGGYAGMTGGGRLGSLVMTARGFTSAQFEGLLRFAPT
jgi:hypothetical protein